MSDNSKIWNSGYTTGYIEIQTIWRSYETNGISHQKNYCKMNRINT